MYVRTVLRIDFFGRCAHAYVAAMPYSSQPCDGEISRLVGQDVASRHLVRAILGESTESTEGSVNTPSYCRLRRVSNSDFFERGHPHYVQRGARFRFTNRLTQDGTLMVCSVVRSKSFFMSG